MKLLMQKIHSLHPHTHTHSTHAHIPPTHTHSTHAHMHSLHTHTHTANDVPRICDSPDIPNGVFPQDCAATTCDCPPGQFECPEDSIIIETRVDGCCLSYECVCPNISCPYLLEGGTGLQPVPQYRGNRFPGRCCPAYDYLGEIKCLHVWCYHLGGLNW